MAATPKPFLARLGLAIGLAGSLAVPSCSLGLSTTGLYSVVTPGSEVVGLSLAGIQGPTFTRNGTAVDTVLPGAVVIAGNLTVNGTTTTINSTTVDVDDRVIRVNKSSGANDPAPTAITGIAVYRGASASVARDHYGLYWDETATKWKLAVNTGGDDATLGAYLNLQVLGLTAATATLSGQLTSTLTTGTAPLVVASATLVANLYGARAVLADSVTTNANLTGPITSVGNATSVAAQTGTGTTFVMDTSPTLVTPALGVATATSLTTSGNITAKNGSLCGIALVPQGGAANFTGSITTALLTASRTYTLPDYDTTIVGGAVGSTQVAYGTASSMTSDSGFTRTALALTVDASTACIFSIGYMKAGVVSGGNADSFYLGQTSNFTTTTYSLQHTSSGQTVLNTASSTSMLFRIGAATKLTLASAVATLASGTTFTISDTTASSTTAGALLIGTGTAATSVTFGGGNANIGGTLASGGTITSGGRLDCNGATTSALGSGQVGFWRSGGTIGTTGDMVLQADSTPAAAAFVFRAGLTTPATICTLSPGTIAATTPTCALAATSLITGSVTDSYTGGIRLTPTLSGAFTTTRLNYLDINNAALAASAVLTDACVFRFDAAAGTHKAVDTGTTKTTPGGVDAWVKHNINGTIYYFAGYLSKTA